MEPGTLCWLCWAEDGCWYPAVVVGTGDPVAVAFLDGDEASVPLTALRRMPLEPGCEVEVNWRLLGLWFAGVVRKRLGAVVQIDYPDGSRHWTGLASLRIPGASHE